MKYIAESLDAVLNTDPATMPKKRLSRSPTLVRTFDFECDVTKIKDGETITIELNSDIKIDGFDMRLVGRITGKFVRDANSNTFDIFLDNGQIYTIQTQEWWEGREWWEGSKQTYGTQ